MIISYEYTQCWENSLCIQLIIFIFLLFYFYFIIFNHDGHSKDAEWAFDLCFAFVTEAINTWRGSLHMHFTTWLINQMKSSTQVSTFFYVYVILFIFFSFSSLVLLCFCSFPTFANLPQNHCVECLICLNVCRKHF